ncbi:MAG: hypothetical protein AB1720_02910 [Pseudomonadota bacterium]
MADGNFVFTILSYVAFFGGGLWYVNRTKHRDRTLLKAFAIFAGIFCGIAGAAVALASIAWYWIGLEHVKVPHALGAVLAIGVILPAWRMATKAIQRPAT